MDKRGQLTAEFILIVGFIIVIVLLVVSYIGPQVEQNSVMAAAREGASAAIANIDIVDISVQPIRVTSLQVTGDTDKTVRILFSGTIPENYKAVIMNKTVNTVVEQGFTQINNSSVKGNNFVYNFIIG
ncbi:hypothetical protein [Methanobacterium alcaliphilum]|uniref:hypothetical protein n=1 Tax=Methanobacterium alcaliphilum TaxID=392018 RepID=UPI00200A7166|nr:hypothetical protein [Methanobacterium alcaliphilum]MCK9150656.1 hypothetical protein [Methanobacterium alcaliphilum]